MYINNKILILCLKGNYYYENFYKYIISNTKFKYDVFLIDNFDVNKKLYYLKNFGVNNIINLFYNYIGNFFSSNLKDICKKRNIDIISVSDQKDLRKKIKKKYLVAFASVDFILKKKILNHSKFGFLNFHCADINKYRGRNCLFWTMLKKNKFVSFTIHKMNEKFDNGNIISLKKFKSKKKYFDNLKLLFVEGQKDAVNILKKKKFKNIGKKPKIGKYYHKPLKSDIEFFKLMGLKF